MSINTEIAHIKNKIGVFDRNIEKFISAINNNSYRESYSLGGYLRIILEIDRSIENVLNNKNYTINNKTRKLIDDYEKNKTTFMKLIEKEIENLRPAAMEALNQIINELKNEVNEIEWWRYEDFNNFLISRSTLEVLCNYFGVNSELSTKKNNIEIIDEKFKIRINKFHEKYSPFYDFIGKAHKWTYPDNHWWWHLDKIVEKEKK